MGTIEIIWFPHGPGESRKIETYVSPTEAPPNWPPAEIGNDPEPEPNRPPARNLD
jgi:hypothetical protein